MIDLSGIRILALEQYGAGPYGSLHLSDLGAEVIKIENRRSGGDVSRTVPPYADGSDSLFYQAFNRSKQSITLDVESDEGREIFHRLVKNADAVYSNLRGDLPARLRLLYEDLSPWNERIVCCHLTGYGRHGARAAEPAYDYLIQAEIGMMSLTGDPAGGPERCGLSIIDFLGGVTGALALATGILSARATGKGTDVDVSLLDVGYSLLNYLAIWTLNEGYVPRRMPDSAHPSLVPSQLFQTSDGYVVVMCNKDKFWVELCTLLNEPDLAADERFASFAGRGAHRDDVVGPLKKAFKQESTQHWLTAMRGRVPIAPVNSVEEALNSAREQGLQVFVNVDHPQRGTIHEMATPIRSGGLPPAPATVAPLMGQSTEEVLRRLAEVTPEEFGRLRAAGVV